jgi:predicted AAA+ superfamily ATPase
MKQRSITSSILRLASQYPVVTITGPRQSGKTTLCKMAFPDKEYISLEEPDIRQFALNDPRGFLDRCKEGAVLDEIQRVPDLLSYIQTYVDKKKGNGRFILTGSHQFELMSSVSQSLAGRTAIARLLPFSLKEAYDGNIPSVETTIYTGFYPGIFDQNLNPTEAMSFYLSTYVERDLRQLVNVRDLNRFETFLRLCAGRIGQILNLSNIGNDCGVNQSTVRHWISVLEASFIVRLVYPYYRNLNKRLIKSPKIYFYDTGFASYLLNINDASQLIHHHMKGALFENLIITETIKSRLNAVQNDSCYFFRDNVGNEVDLITEDGGLTTATEIKSGMTVSEDFFRGLSYIQRNDPGMKRRLIYGGDSSYTTTDIEVIGWKDIAS